MIRIFDQTYMLDDPLVIAALIGAGLTVIILALLVLSLRAARRSARMAEPLARQLLALGQNVQQLGQGQAQLQGGLQAASDTQANAQVQVI